MSMCSELSIEAVAGDLASRVELEVAGDHVKRSSRRRQGKAAIGGRRRDEKKDRRLFPIRIDKEKSPLVEKKIPQPREDEEKKKKKELEEAEEEERQDEDEAAREEMRSFRLGWEECFGDSYGSFEDNTSVRPMRYTEGTIPRYACCEDALQISSVQVMETKDGLEWPLHVYG